MKIHNIPQLSHARYSVDQDWFDLERVLQRYNKDYGLDLNPDFQRDYVWTQQQKIDYVEWGFRGGRSGMDIFFNCPNWNGFNAGVITIVDGKQRLQAVLDFMHNEIPAYNIYFKDYEGPFRMGPHFRFHVNDLKSREDILKWYIGMNTGGTIHTPNEIDKVKKLLEEEQKCKVK